MEDELSTSAGSGSDNEVVAASGDDEPPSHSTSGSDLDVAVATSVVSGRSTKKAVAPEPLAVNVVFDLCTFLLALLFSTICKTQQLAQLLAPQARPSTQSAPQLSPLQEAGRSRTASRVSLVLDPPPGLVQDYAGCCGEEAARLPLLAQHIGPPPGLELPPGLESPPGLGPPPGLQVCSSPPGLLLPHSQPRAVASRRSRTKRSKQVPIACGATPQASAPLKFQKQPLLGGTSLARAAKPEHKQPEAPQAPSPLPQPKPMAPAPLVRQEFDQAVYRKELSDVLRDLASVGCSNVAASVRRIRAQNVPRERQAAEFSDILTRAAEENRGYVRRLSFAFAAGLAAGEAFSRAECEKGLELFFGDVFEDLAAEVPRLGNKLANELAPTLRTVFSQEQIARLIPLDCRAP